MQAQLTLAGTLPRSPEMTYNPQGLAICKFSLASNIYDKTISKNDTQWINCVCFDKQAESVAQFCAKGTAVLVVGPLNVRQYTTKDGRNGVSIDITVNKIEYIKDFGREYVLKSNAPIDDFDHTEVAPSELVKGQPF